MRILLVAASKGSTFLRDARAVSAVEFALLAPLMILLLAGTIAYGLLFSTHISLQQLTAEAARSSIAGLSADERVSIVERHVADTLPRYFLLDPDRASVAVEIPRAGFTEIVVRYDASAHPAYVFRGLLPLPTDQVIYRQVIRDGGLA
ncbi:TadE/TadG family type IV pilus assembly protein [Glycocaulis abyssi]|uniref:TadE/TadG family type IV pilus assembly protein n=1 Tax=Glycocaulis abyssi TaxID=1433403 RepID=A0ABV9NEE0_9PROT